MKTLPFGLRQAALAECHDCYAAHIPSLELRVQLMHGLAVLWCLTEHDVDVQMHLNKPMIQVS